MLLSHSQRIMWIMKIAPLYCSCFENLWFKPAPVIFSISWRNFSWEARKIVLQGWISLHTQNVKYDMKPCDKYKIPSYSSFSRKTVWILTNHWKQYQSNHWCLSNTHYSMLIENNINNIIDACQILNAHCSLKTISIKSLLLVKHSMLIENNINKIIDACQIQFWKFRVSGVASNHLMF